MVILFKFNRNLLNKDALSKSDPMCVVYVEVNNSWTEHGRTEGLINNLNPAFATKILIGYRFEELQKLKFKIYDVDSKSKKLDDHDFLGEAECNLGQIVSSANFVATLNHPKSKTKGELCVTAVEIGPNKEEVEFLFSAEGFKKSGPFSKPDPFLAIYKEEALIHRTPFVKDDCSPKWKKFTIPMRAIRAKDGEDVKLTLQCWNWNGDGKHKLIGEVKVNTGDILKAPKSFDLMEKVYILVLIYFLNYLHFTLHI